MMLLYFKKIGDAIEFNNYGDVHMNCILFGKQMKSIRIKRGVTAEELAKVLDVNVRTIGQIESGRRSTTINNLIKICNYLDISPEFLLLTELNEKLERNDSIYVKLYELILELKPGECKQFYDFIELMIKNREYYK
jgi:transcriptional regulator with XRE-family HTH domain